MRTTPILLGVCCHLLQRLSECSVPERCSVKGASHPFGAALRAALDSESLRPRRAVRSGCRGPNKATETHSYADRSPCYRMSTTALHPAPETELLKRPNCHGRGCGRFRRTGVVGTPKTGAHTRRPWSCCQHTGDGGTDSAGSRLICSYLSYPSQNATRAPRRCEDL